MVKSLKTLCGEELKTISVVKSLRTLLGEELKNNIHGEELKTIPMVKSLKQYTWHRAATRRQDDKG